MAHSVERVDSEADAQEQLCLDREVVDCGDAGHVFGWRAEADFVAGQQAIAPAVDEDERVDRELRRERRIGISQRDDTDLLERENARRLTSFAEPAR